MKEQCDLIQLAFPCEHKDVYSAVFEEESLFLLLPDNHRLASKKEGIFINEIAGETLLALPEAGYWTEIVKKLIPDAHIIYQNEQTDFEAHTTCIEVVSSGFNGLKQSGLSALSVM